MTLQESVLEVLARSGNPVLSSCSEGICGTCEGVLTVPWTTVTSLSDAERQERQMFVCLARCSERLVLICRSDDNDDQPSRPDPTVR